MCGLTSRRLRFGLEYSRDTSIVLDRVQLMREMTTRFMRSLPRQSGSAQR